MDKKIKLGVQKELKFKVQPAEDQISSPCSCSSTSQAGALKQDETLPAWVAGTVKTSVGVVPKVSAEIKPYERWEHLKCRTSAFRDNYKVSPGLYAVGEPDKDSHVLASANYKLSFDALRRELKGLNVWILVLDTKGINVWCAAGKGTFGTDELVRRIDLAQIDKVVDHRKIIVPQLGAPGVSAHKVKQATGFRVYYGPVNAKDIPAYIKADYKASREMRTIRFGVIDRLVLTPMEINPAMKKYPLYALLVLGIFGLQPSGIFFKEAVMSGLPFLIFGFISVLAGAFLTPILLPFIPFRSFAIKGWIVGMFSTILYLKLSGPPNMILVSFSCLFFPLASSYIALQFTGSTTFTGMTGVKKELRFAIPVYILGGVVSVLVLTIFKLNQWGVL
jgi:hypothetical protein